MKTILAALVLAALPLASHAEAIDIKTGAWEITLSTLTSGMPVPADELAKMPPEQRAKIEAMMRARAGKVNTSTLRSCLTQQDLDRGELMGKEPDKNCVRKVISQTARHFEFDETCTAPGPRKMHGRFDAPSAERYTASFDGTQGDGKVHVDMVGRWVGATCRKGDED